jgi:hypothetical protein
MVAKTHPKSLVLLVDDGSGPVESALLQPLVRNLRKDFPKNFSSAGVNGESVGALGALSVCFLGASINIERNAPSIMYSNFAMWSSI